MALTDDLISWWSLDESSGNASDSHGTNTLTDNNSVGSAAGKVGNARDFTPSSSHSLTCASNSTLQTGDISFSVACWFYADSVSGEQGIVTKWDMSFGQSGDEYMLGILSSQLAFRVRRSGQQIVSATNFGTVSVSTWYFAAGGYSASADQLWVSVNAGTPNTLSLSTGPATGAQPFTLGRGPSSYFDGRIDEVGFWKRDIRSDLASIYNSGNGIAYPGASGPSTGAKRRRRLICGA